MNEPAEVSMCCTGKGEHRALTFRTYYGVDDHRWCYRRWDEVWIDEARAHTRQWAYRDIPAEGVKLRCRRCGRDTRLSADTMVKLLDGAAAAGVSSLDISVLPF